MLYILASGLLLFTFTRILRCAKDEDMNPYHPTNASPSRLSFTFDAFDRSTKKVYPYKIVVRRRSLELAVFLVAAGNNLLQKLSDNMWRLLEAKPEFNICGNVTKNGCCYNVNVHSISQGITTPMISSRKDCPSCCRSYGTNRVLRNDPNMDSIIEVVIGDINKYEEEIKDSTLAEELHQQQPELL